MRGHLSPAHYAEALEQYVEELDAYYADIVYRREREIELPDGVFAALCEWAYDKSWDVEVIDAKSITYKGHTFVSSKSIEVTE